MSSVERQDGAFHPAKDSRDWPSFPAEGAHV